MVDERNIVSDAELDRDVEATASRLLMLLTPDGGAFSGGVLNAASSTHSVPEEYGLAGMTSQRLLEFRSGRIHARQALRELGEEEAHTLPRARSGAVIWPPAFEGSISHCHRYCGAVVIRASVASSIGFDVEVAHGIEAREATIIAVPSELHGMRDALDLIFSAKESVYKAYFPLGNTMLDFHDVHVRIDRISGRFDAVVAEDKPTAAGVRAFGGYVERVRELVISFCLPSRPGS